MLKRTSNFQVFDLAKQAPGEALQTIYINLERLKTEGDKIAAKIQERLKIIMSRLLHNYLLFVTAFGFHLV